MDDMAKLSAMLDLAEELGLAVRPMPASAQGEDTSAGAVVRLRGKEVVFLDASAAAAEQIAVLASALRGRGELQQRFLPPEIRQLLD